MKGQWVKIHSVVLSPEERAPQIPEDTKKTPLEMWTKGFLQSDASLGDEVEIVTITGRKERGTLVEIEPSYTHSFGKCIPELLQIGITLKKVMRDGE